MNNTLVAFYKDAVFAVVTDGAILLHMPNGERIPFQITTTFKTEADNYGQATVKLHANLVTEGQMNDIIKNGYPENACGTTAVLS